MSAQVTEAHRELARRIMFEFTQAGTATASDVRMAAQIIADSEAKAVAEWQDFVHLKGEAIDSLLLECDRLSAEVERLKRDYDYDHKCLHEVRERCELWKQRAERAEAELAKAKAILASIEEDGTEEHNAAVSLRQELATERARLDWLQAHALAQHSESISISKLGKHYNGFPGSLRAAIDAAMKEETK